MLSGNARHADLGLLLLRLCTGAFLIYQSHDNVSSAARMDEFVKFLVQFNFPMPELMAPLSVYAQFAAASGSCLACSRGGSAHHHGQLHGRLLDGSLVSGFCGLVASADPCLLGLYYGLRGGGRFAIDALIEGRR
jgi:putative oxidoreductase